uniref:hypothetical protein n=1 Tax=Salmonella enterica TaxID=28901 RepID=UPI00398C66C0
GGGVELIGCGVVEQRGVVRGGTGIAMAGVAGRAGGAVGTVDQRGGGFYRLLVILQGRRQTMAKPLLSCNIKRNDFRFCTA